MRDDLLHARASIDWAVSKFPSLEQRIEEWLRLNVSPTVKEIESKTDNLVVATAKEPLPLAFHVEVGAYLNTIRSSWISSPAPSGNDTTCPMLKS